jgi:uncharacterized protein (DUF362 family)
MKNRREFLKGTGAVLLGSQSAFALAGSLSSASADQDASSAKSKVVIARDLALHGQGSEPNEQRVINLLDHAMTTYTGRDPKDAWKHVIAMGLAQDKVIGLKVNGLGSKGIATHTALIMAVAERLQLAGVKAGNILVWDQNAHFLEACGMTVNTDPGKIRCYSSEVAGFEEQESSWGVARIRITKILTRECATIINLPILKDHSMAGVTFALKNMYGVVDRPFTLHADNCNPAVADLNAIPVFREKIRLTIGDAMSSVYDGGPGFHPERLWYPNALIVGEDRVAVDQTAWGILERKRAEVGMPTFEAAGRPPRYIATAADASHRLGTNDPKRINLVEV